MSHGAWVGEFRVDMTGIIQVFPTKTTPASFGHTLNLRSSEESLKSQVLGREAIEQCNDIFMAYRRWLAVTDSRTLESVKLKLLKNIHIN